MVRTFNNQSGLMNQSKNLIMLIEDDMDHAELIIRAMEEHSIPIQIVHFHDGSSALNYLFDNNQFHDSAPNPRPQLILLDMHLPRMDGIEILHIIKESDELRMIPVVMLTTSAAESDVTRAYCNHANSYLAKPLEVKKFKELVDVTCSYWLGVNEQPKIQYAMHRTCAL